jgi:hypothetical protein
LPGPAAPRPAAPPVEGNGKHVSKAAEPKTGAELSAWLDNLDSWLAERGHAPKGHLKAECIRLAGTTEPMERWPVATVNGTVQAAKALAAKLR